MALILFSIMYMHLIHCFAVALILFTIEYTDLINHFVCDIHDSAEFEGLLVKNVYSKYCQYVGTFMH